MRVGILIVVSVLTSVSCFAQQAATVLDSVEVYGIPDERFLAGASFTTVDSALLRQQRGSHLGDVLATQLPVYFRSYGQGMISGISLRGTAPQHTAVLWNGININSFSLGQADFSILPASAFGSVKVHAGGGSARYGSGALGGTVLLASPEAPSQEIFHIAQVVGSFGQYTTEAGGGITAGRWNLHTQVYHVQSENDFKIHALDERQPHAAFRQMGVLQDIVYTLADSKSLALHYWYHDADRDVQPPIGQYFSSDTQQDKNHRLSLQYKSDGPHRQFTATGGYVRDVIVYQKEALITRWTGNVKEAFLLPARIHTEVSAEWNHIRADIDEYKQYPVEEDRFDFMVSMQKTVGTRLSLALNLRQPVVTGFSPPFLPYLGVEYTIVKRPAATFTFRGNASRNYRVPTFNDRYWKNAGDRNLKPELSYAAEAGWRWTWHRLTVDNTWYAQEVDQWLQWVPVDGAYIPRNVRHVRVRGAEVRVYGPICQGVVRVIAGVNYQYTRSITTEAPPNDPSLDRQLIYTPEQTASGYLRGQWRDYNATVQAQYSGRRYYLFANEADYSLDPYSRIDLSVGRTLTLGRHGLTLQASVQNLLDEEYRQYAAYAMPGRYYTLQLNYQLNSISK
ncbi:TonB-dependent receptor [Dawidia soli]|uniref:TonB-dependent receptor n=1 Tax=Dawidia soli TaxID=2782352 RepID=A0AAP2D9Q3_9BACT|nr:TonB-dependent receptor [Dawidia soli]MBT1687557.1 TonB-dependent receptor [Dawidia soli]